jgi:hypothetical protein
MTLIGLPTLLDTARAEVVASAPAAGPGNWAGAPSAVVVNGVVWLAYRVRRPLASGRGVAVVVARSLDGVRFTTVATVRREQFGADSLERPALVRADGGWRLFLSCATPGSKHWWVGMLEAATAAELPQGRYRVCLPGDEQRLAVKDPVVERLAQGWRMWVCCHPLTEPGQEDRMFTSVADSDDGVTFSLGDTVLLPRPGEWDARGTRVTAVLGSAPLTVLYDGRATAQANWCEQTGVATTNGPATTLVAGSGPPMSSPHSDGALRYASVVTLPSGERRAYVEAARPDGAHDLLTQLLA